MFCHRYGFPEAGEARQARQLEPAPVARDPDVRVSHAEREHVVALLGRHYAEGRLTVAEYEERVGGALEARVGRDLDDLLADLPAGPPAPAAAAPGPGLSWPDVVPYLPRVLAVTAVVALALGSGLWVLWFLWPALAFTTPRVPRADVLPRRGGAVASSLGVDRPYR